MSISSDLPEIIPCRSCTRLTQFWRDGKGGYWACDYCRLPTQLQKNRDLYLSVRWAKSHEELSELNNQLKGMTTTIEPKEKEEIVKAGRQRRQELRKLRILFCGSREWVDPDPIIEQLKRFNPANTVIVNGYGRGADLIADTQAKLMGFETDPFPAKWVELGKPAGPIRNRQMIESGIDEVVAFTLPGIVGTQHTIDLATKRGIKVTIVEGHK